VIRGLLFGVGILLGMMAGREPVELPELDPNATGWLTTPVRESLAEGGREDRRRWAADLTEQEQSLRSQLDQLIGDPVKWPDNPPHEMTEAFFEESLLAGYQEGLDRSPAAVDCQLYPCLAVFADPLAQEEEERFFDAVRARNELFRAWGKSRVTWTSEWGVNHGPDGHQWNIFAWSLLPEDASEELREQVKVRIQLQMIAQRRENGLVPGEL